MVRRFSSIARQRWIARYGSLRAQGRRGVSFGFNCQTARGYAFAFSRHEMPEVCVGCRPRKQGGRREDRVHAAPAVSRAIVIGRSAHEHTGSAEAIRPSLRNGFTTYLALAPVTGLCDTVARAPWRELDTCVGVSGP